MKLNDINEAIGADYVATPEELNDEIANAKAALNTAKRRGDRGSVNKFELRIKVAQAKLAKINN